MKKYSWVLFSLFLVFGGFNLKAQKCGTDVVDALHRANLDAKTLKAAEEMELRYQNAIENGAQRGLGGVRVIPVVVHLIQMTPAAAISDARVQSQIDVLNEDFQLLNADSTLIPIEFQAVAANSNIRFCLATIDPNGCPTNGINRVVAPELATHGIDDETALKSFVQWPPQKYLNMWVPVNLKDNLLGYATFPTWLASSPQNDGVVVNGQNFGRGNGTPSSSYNLGRTATHEVGHWLGLFHTFQGGCSGMTASNCASQGDRVCDTPPTNNANYSCPGTINTCNETPTDLNDQTMNYMDYVDDACMYMYTQGQKSRMEFFLDNERSVIWSPANLTATGCDGTLSPGCVPVVDFVASRRVVCLQDSVAFTEMTTNAPTSWNWNFQAGNPATSSLQNPKVVWSSPGIYEVRLIASNSIGADTLVKTAYVEVVDPSQQTLVYEGFESVTNAFPNGWYATDDFSSAGYWKWNTGNASEGQNSVRLDNFNNMVSQSKQYLYTTPFDFSSSGGGMLYFDRAYKRRSAFVIDSLQILISTDCGMTWQKAWEKAGFALATAPGYKSNAEYLPLATDWVTDSLDLSPFVGANSLRFCFRGVGGNSQSIHLDYLRLNLITSTTALLSQTFALNIANNPFADFPRIEIQGGSGKTISGFVTDIQGRKILEIPGQKLHSDFQTIEILSEKWLSLGEGLYFLVIEDGNQRLSRKLLKVRDRG